MGGRDVSLRGLTWCPGWESGPTFWPMCCWAVWLGTTFLQLMPNNVKGAIYVVISNISKCIIWVIDCTLPRYQHINPSFTSWNKTIFSLNTHRPIIWETHYLCAAVVIRDRCTMRTNTVASINYIWTTQRLPGVLQLLQHLCHLLIVKPLGQTPADVQIEVVWVQQVMLIHEIRLAKENIFERNVCAGSPHSSSLASFKRYRRMRANAAWIMLLF